MTLAVQTNTGLSTTQVNTLISSAIAAADLKDVITVPYATDSIWDYSLGYNAELLLEDATTDLQISNVTEGSYGTLKVIQDGTGNRLLVFPAGSVMQGGTSTLDFSAQSAGSYVLLSFYYDGTSFYWTFGETWAS